MTRPTFALLPLAVGCTLGAPRVVDTRDLGMDASSIDMLEIVSDVGDLEVVGASGATAISGRVDLLSYRLGSAQDEVARDGLVVALEDRGGGVARLWVGLVDAPEGFTTDIVIEVPADLMLVVDDGSGDTTISNVAWLDVVDGSGDLAVYDIASDVSIEDGSGDMLVSGVGGDVDVLDDSGDIEVRNVAGIVTVDDGSGDVTIENAGGITIVDDGSGELIIR